MASSETLVVKEINFWPDLAKYLTAYHPEVRPENGFVRPVHIELNCGVCTKEVGLPDWVKDPKLVPELGNPGKEAETLMVLACGHVIGEACWVEWKKTCEGQNKPHSCPFCRFEMRYSICEHNIPARRLRTTTKWPRVEEIIPKTQIWRIGKNGEPEMVGRSLGNAFEIEWREWSAKDRVSSDCMACRISKFKAQVDLRWHLGTEFIGKDYHSDMKSILYNLKGGCSDENIELVENIEAAEEHFLERLSEFYGKMLVW